MTMTSLLWRHLYLEHSQSMQYFTQQFSFTPYQVLNSTVSYEKVNKFNKQMCLNINVSFFNVLSKFI